MNWNDGRQSNESATWYKDIQLQQQQHEKAWTTTKLAKSDNELKAEY